MLLVDDHTRHKWVYFLKAKSDAPACIRRFVSSFNALASLRSATPVRVVGSLHSDNAGELTSLAFKELLDENLIAQTTCPPHVHQLNGVAERAIRAAMELTRSYLTHSGAQAHHWPYALEMAVDVLNRTSGPVPDRPDGPTSHELVTGERPSVLNIMPFGCRVFALKPREQYSKTTIDPRAWVGINLGRCGRTPGAYYVFVPATGRVHLTSECYFREALFPLRPKGQQIDEHVAVSAPPSLPPQPPASPAPAPPAPVAPPPPAAAAAAALAGSLHDAYASATGGAPCARRVLLLFSGPYYRPDGLARGRLPAQARHRVRPGRQRLRRRGGGARRTQ
jgi:hypothetical protein